MPLTDEQIDADGTWHDLSARVEFVRINDQIDALVAERAAAVKADADAGKPEDPFAIANASRELQDRIQRMAGMAFAVRNRGWRKTE